MPGTEWMQQLQLSNDDKAKILSGNAKRLLKM
jgi:predicted TIM-barrel fold metal-dependent hydrolase